MNFEMGLLFEFAAVLNRGYKLPQSQAATSIALLQNDPAVTILYPTAVVLQELLTLLKQDTGVYIYDLLLAATARSYGMDYIITDDRDLARIKGVKVFNPFKK